MGKQYLIDNEDVTLYTIGELARFIGREPVTIRMWESTGMIPKATYRDPSNRRLYSVIQMEGLRDLCAKYMKQGVKTPAEFTDKVQELFYRKVETKTEE